MKRDAVMQLLIGVRQRRSRALDEAVHQALRQEQAAIDGVKAAQDRLVSAVAAEARERDRLRSLTDPGQTFDVQLLLLREHLVSAEKEKVVRQQGELEQCDSALQQRRGELRARRADRARNERRIDALADDLERWRDERRREEDDAQDEEAEEAASTRLARARGKTGAS